MNEFIKGRQGNLSKADEVYVNELKETLNITRGLSFTEWSMQSCKNLFTSISFQGRKLIWNQLPTDEQKGLPNTVSSVQSKKIIKSLSNCPITQVV